MITLSVRLRTPIETDNAIEQLTSNIIKAMKWATLAKSPEPMYHHFLRKTDKL